MRSPAAASGVVLACALLACALLLVARAACAQASSSVAAAVAEQRAPGLNWVRLEGASECLSAAELAERVEARVGRVLFTSATEAELFADGSVRAANGGWDVVLEISQRDGTVLGRRVMRFEGERCAVIDDAVVLVIAVTLYPNSGLIDAGIPLDPRTAAHLEALFGAEPTDPDPASLPAAPPASTRASTDASDQPVRARAVPAVRSEPWKVALDAALIAGVGQLPEAALGAGGALLITPPGAWPLQAAVFWLPPQTVPVEDAGGDARFDLLLASLAVCPWQPSWLRSLALCGAGELGRLRAQPRFVSKNRAASDVVANMSALALLRVPLAGGLHARAALVLSMPLIQRSYEFQTLERTPQRVFRMPQVAARLELGLGWQL